MPARSSLCQTASSTWWSEAVRRVALLLVGLAALAGCGFHPLYSEKSRTADEPFLAAIKVAPIPNRVGQMLEFALRDELNPRGLAVPPRYVLNVTLVVYSADQGLQRDATATSGLVNITAYFSLTETKTNKNIYASRTASTAAFDVTNDSFSAVVAGEDATARNVLDISHEIRVRLALFLREQRLRAG